MKTIFEQGALGHGLSLLPACDVPVVTLAPARKKPLHLPQVSENELIRHYTALSHRVHGMNDGFYPLGSCTMKYNPKVNEALAALPGFARLHPLQPEQTAQGALELLYETGKLLGEVTGMDAFTLQPAAGAHGEFTGLLLIKAYHLARGDVSRTEIIVPDSAHGTNPASSVMAGFRVVNIPSGADGYQIFGENHEERLLCIIVMSLWTFTVNSFTLYAGSSAFMTSRPIPDEFLRPIERVYE